MDRRTIIATAGAITLTVLAGSTAIAANVGILGNGSKAPVGQLSPIVKRDTTSTAARAERAKAAVTSTLPPQVETIYVDQYVRDTPKSAAPPPVGTVAPAPAATATEPAASPGFDDGGGEGDDSSASTSPGGYDDSGSEHDSEVPEGGEGDD